MQKRTDTQDAHGQPIPAWSTFATRWAGLAYDSGGESFSADQERATVRRSLTLRHLSGVNPLMRVLMPREKTTLAAAVTTTSGTALTVASGGTFPPHQSFRALIESELVNVTAGNGTTSWTVTRGMDGTSAATHASGALVQHMVPLDIEAAVDPDGRRRETLITAKEVVGG